MSALLDIVQGVISALNQDGDGAQPQRRSRPPSRASFTNESDPPGAPAHQAHHHSRRGVNENAENQRNPWYVDMRAKASQEGDAMARCFQESHDAYQAGDGARAKQLSNEGHEHQHQMEALNAQASEWIFKENNTDSEPGEVDLHGLFVKEAITFTDRAIVEARQRGDSSIRLIVGKGLHSSGHVAKLKPAIEELMTKHRIVAELDPTNDGVLIVTLGGGRSGMGAEEITRRLGDEGKSCIIM